MSASHAEDVKLALDREVDRLLSLGKTVQKRRRRRRKRKPACKFFLRGSCSWGSACKFAHKRGAPAERLGAERLRILQDALVYSVQRLIISFSQRLNLF